MITLTPLKKTPPAFQMDRCTWRGFKSFKAYVWACVTSFNLIGLARHVLVKAFT